MDTFNREDRVVIARFGMSERCTRFVSGKFFLNDSGLTLASREPNKLLQPFLNHWAFSVNDEIYALGKGTAQKNLDLPVFRCLEVPIPPVPEQQRIVTILDEAFEGIATAKANAEKNLQNAREIFDNYLGSVFSCDTPSVSIRPLGELATFRNGINYTKQSKGESVRIIGVKDFRKNFWAPMEDLESVTLDGCLPAIDAVKAGDILTVRSNGNPLLIGRCLLVPEHDGSVSHSGFTIRIRLHTETALPHYVCHFLKSKTARQELIEGGNGANIKSLNQGTLAGIGIPVPSIDKQQEVIQSVETMAEESAQLQEIYRRKLTAIDELKQSLLHRAFNGDL